MVKKVSTVLPDKFWTCRHSFYGFLRGVPLKVKVYCLQWDLTPPETLFGFQPSKNDITWAPQAHGRHISSSGWVIWHFYMGYWLKNQQFCLAYATVLSCCYPNSGSKFGFLGPNDGPVNGDPPKGPNRVIGTLAGEPVKHKTQFLWIFRGSTHWKSKSFVCNGTSSNLVTLFPYSTLVLLTIIDIFISIVG